MKIIETYVVKGRGPVAILDALPAELECGMTVRCGELRWKVVGIESSLMGRERDNGQARGIVLKGPVGISIGMTLEIEKEPTG